MSFSVCIFVICSMSNVGQIQANLRKNAAEMSFVILEMSFGVWEMSFTHFWEMSFTRNAQKKACIPIIKIHKGICDFPLGNGTFQIGILGATF